MPRKSTDQSKFPAKPPRFQSEAEEADWWVSTAGRRYASRRFEEKARAGKIITTEETSLTPELRERMKRDGVMVRFKNGIKIKRTDPAVVQGLMERIRAKQTRSVSLRIPLADLETAKKLAEKTGIGYQTLLKEIIHEGLQRAS